MTKTQQPYVDDSAHPELAALALFLFVVMLQLSILSLHWSMKMVTRSRVNGVILRIVNFVVVL